MTFDTSAVMESLPILVRGAGITVLLVGLSLGIGTLIGLVAMAGKLLGRGLLYRIAVIYVGVFRGLPETVLIFWIYYCGPLVLNVKLSAFGSGLLALSLVAGAYLCEIFRAGFESVPRSQLEAAHALSLPPTTIGISIIAPQAFQTMLPTLIGLVTIMLKNSAILSAIGTAELFYEAYTIAATNYKYFELITAAGVIYFIIIFPLSMISQSAERKLIAKKR